MPEPQSKVAPAKAAPAKAPAKADAKAPADAAAAQAPPSRLQWLVGWVLVPTTIVGILFGGGALVGAHFSESWLARAIVWIVELFA